MASSQAMRREAAAKGLYRPEAEHDACGVGFVANIKGCASHKVIEDALLILHNLDHRGAVGADPLFGDGAGILIQIPDAFYRAEMARQDVTLPAPGEYGVGRNSSAWSKRKARLFWAGETCPSTVKCP